MNKKNIQEEMRDIIKEQQEIDKQVFGFTKMRDDGSYSVDNNDILNEIQEANTKIDDLKECISELRIEKLESNLSELNDTVKKLIELLEENDLTKKQNNSLNLLELYIGQVRDLVSGRISYLLFIILIATFLIYIK